MAKDPYFPQTDEQLRTWLENFNLKIPGYAATFGLSAPQVAIVNDDALNFIYWLDQSNLFITEKEERVTYKNLLRDGPIGAPAGTAPSLPAIPAPPAPTPPGIEPRMRLLVQQIKNHPNYTEAIGKDLNIIGDEQSTQKSALKPVLKLVLTGAGVDVQWKKGIADALRVEKESSGASAQKGAASWNLLAVDTEPNYLDTTPVTEPAMWKYRAVYIIKDEPVWQWSDVAQIAVG